MKLTPSPLLVAIACLAWNAIPAAADTPNELANPAAFTASIPQLASQTSWTQYATPEQVRLFDGAQTEWPVVSSSEYSLAGFSPQDLGGKVPPPGVHPRLLFSAEDLPNLAKRLGQGIRSQKALLESRTVLSRTIWNPDCDEGKIFAKLASGDLAGLEWPEQEGMAPGFKNSHYFKGWKQQCQSSMHAGYLPYLLAAAAFDCLLREDTKQGTAVASAIASYYRLREPLIDRLNGEYNDQKITPNDFWRPMHQMVGNDNLAWCYDCAAKWMTDEQKGLMRRVISKATRGKRSYGMSGPTRWRDTNWVGWDLQFFLTSMAIEGEERYDPGIYPVALETARAYLDWGIDSHGTIFETNGKNGAGLEYELLSLHVLARHGDNLFGHPHLTKLTSAQCAMIAPWGRVNVNNGTWGGNSPFGVALASLLKGYYPSDPCADWLIRQSEPELKSFDLKGYEKAVKDPAAKLPVPWTKFTLVVPQSPFELRDWDGTKTAAGELAPIYDRSALRSPLTFIDPEHGILSARSGTSPDALFLHFEARPDLRGVGHQHHDSGHFYLGALGEMWAIEASPKASFSPDHNTILIDGTGHSDVSAAPRVEWLGAEESDTAVIASANLKNAYDYGWTTPMHFSWQLPGRQDGTWKLTPDTSPELVSYYKGTQRTKMRIWGDTYFQSNWGPAMRIEGNPVQYAYRSVGMVRGKHPYAVVCDAIRKDDSSHRYEWLMQVPEGVRIASLPGAPGGCPSATLTRAPSPGTWGRESADRDLPKGTPMLMVVLMEATSGSTAALAPNTVGSEKLPIRLEQLTAKPNTGSKPVTSRLVIEKQAVDPAFNILLVPVRYGEALPTVTCDASNGQFSVAWNDQKEMLSVQHAPDGKMGVKVTRGAN